MRPSPPLARPLTALALLAACSGGSTAPTGTTDGAVAGSASTEARPAPVGPAPPTPTTLARIPARFVGTWAPDAAECKSGDGYERIYIKPDQVGFFETVGEVQDVAEAGGSTRITLRERVGDSYPIYPIMISLADDGRALNYLRHGERKLYVKCAG